MTDLLITSVGDAWVNSTRTSVNYGSARWVSLKSGERRGYLKPALRNILGRTVLSATLAGRVGPGHVAQTYTATPATEHWTPGKVTWANQPAVNTAAAVTEAVGALPDGGLVEIDVTSIVQAVAAGTAWHGLRLSTGSATQSSFYSSDSGEPAWELLVVLSDAPEIPSNLRPDGGAVPTGRPVLAWDFVDFGGESTEQAEARVQVDTPAVGVDPDELAPDFDSGWVVNVDPEFDLAASAYVSPGAGPTFWRVQVKDAAGDASEWSDWADFTVAALPTLVIDAPTGALGDPAPTVIAHLTGGTLQTWRVTATGPDRSDVRFNTGLRTGAINFQIPLRNSDGRRVLPTKNNESPAWIHVRAWDDVDRAEAVGAPSYVEQWIPVEFADTAAIAPTGLTVVQSGDGDPRLVWQWHITDIPESFVLEVDGEAVARFGADDFTPNAGWYTWTDNGEVPPLREQTLAVRALSDGGRSAAAQVRNWSHTVKGLWLLPDDGKDPIVLAGTGVGGFARSDRVATYVPTTGPEVDIVYDFEGVKGGFTGEVSTGTHPNPDDLWATLDRIERLSTSHNRTARMVWGSRSMTVMLRSLHHLPAEGILPSNLQHAVSFGFVQVGD